MATSGSLTTTKYDGRYYKLAWERTSYSIANNTSTIKWTLSAVGGNSGWYAERTLKVVIAGVTVFSKTARKERYAGTIDTGTITLKHNTDGTKSFSASVSAAVYGSSVNCTGSNTFTLNTISRKATITSASNFTDEGSPKIEYKNPAGSSATTLQACIADSSGQNIIVAYRNISKTGSSYTFNFTDAEKTALRKHIKTGNSATVTFYVESVVGSTTYRDHISKTLSLVDYTPTLSPTISNYQQTRDLTGDTTTLIRYYSTANVAIGAAARKGATLKSKKVTNSGKSRTTDGDITSVTSKTFTFTATDSRGYTTTVNKDAGWVPYIKPTCNLKVNIGVDGNANVTVSGSFYNGKFGNATGAKTNALIVKCRYAEAGQTPPDWEDVEPLIFETDGNIYTARQELTGLDYSKTYVFQAKATDKIDEFAVTTPEKKVKSRPIFDWSEDDFHVHGDLKVEQNNLYYSLLGAGKALSTAYTMTCTPTAGSGWSNASASAYLIGNCLRVYVVATRNEAPLMGNQTNETVMTFKLEHGGKIDNLYRVGFCNDTEGSVGSYSAQAAKNSDGTFTITILQTATTPYSSSATTASKGMNGYFIMPADIQLAAYV